MNNIIEENYLLSPEEIYNKIKEIETREEEKEYNIMSIHQLLFYISPRIKIKEIKNLDISKQNIPLILDDNINNIIQNELLFK